MYFVILLFVFIFQLSFYMCYFSYERINQIHSALSASIRQGIPEIK